MTKNHPIDGKLYQITGGTGEKCLSNGNTWEESEIKIAVKSLKERRKQLQKLYKNNLWEK